MVLDGGVGTGGRLYEAACLLKSVIRDRAYFMVSERVDIAAAVNASGVVLSDQGLIFFSSPVINCILIYLPSENDSKSCSIHIR